MWVAFFSSLAEFLALLIHVDSGKSEQRRDSNNRGRHSPVGDFIAHVITRKGMGGRRQRSGGVRRERA